MASARNRFSVPSSEVSRIKRFAGIEVEKLEAVERAVREQALTLDRDALYQAVADRAHIDLPTASLIISVVWRLALVQRCLGLSTASFLDGLRAALPDAAGNGWSADETEALAKRTEVLAKLLDADAPLASSAKAGALLFEQQLVFCTSRVVTDLRPVFDDAAKVVQGFVTFHTLALTCHEGAETRELHIAMDLNDVIGLCKQLERAKRKEEVISGSLTDAGLSVIPTGAESDAQGLR